jgi:diguanylate cyclase (GGDEF)-like protein/PAS domain S-box-containing protein
VTEHPNAESGPDPAAALDSAPRLTLPAGEERYRQIVELISEGIWAVDADNNTTFVNPAMADMLGYTVDAMLGRSLFDFIAADEQSVAAAKIERRRAGVAERHDSKLVDRHGNIVWAAVNAAPLLDGAGQYQGTLAVVTNVTERRVAESRFRALVHRSSDITTILEPDGTWRWSSAAGTRVLGYPEDFNLAGGIFSLLHPDDIELALSAFREVTAGRRGPDDPVILRVRAADGTWRCLETVATNLVDDDAVHGVVLNSRDVSERVRVEEELRVSERLFRAVVQNASDVVTVAHADGTITYTSPSIEKVLGYEPDELIGTQTRDLMHPDDAPRVEQVVAEQFLTDAPERPIEYRVRHRDGSWRLVEGTIANLLDVPGIDGIVGTNRDITERVEAEAVLRLTQERFQNLVQHSSDLVSIATAEGVITYISPSVKRLLGFDPDEIVGGGGQPIMDSDDIPRVAAAIVDESDPDAEPTSVEFRAQHRDGSWRVFEGVTTNLLDEPSIAGFVNNARDVTQRHAAERKAAQLTEVLEQSHEVVVLSEPSGALVYANRRAREFLGLAGARHVGELSTIESRERLRAEIMPFVRRHGLWTGELALRTTDGAEVPMIATLQGHREGDDIVLISTIAHDITELKKTQTRLHHEATHDPLTGLPNRALFNEVAEQALGRAARHHGTTAVMFLDLDGFKSVNDSLGHEAGDRLLIEIAKRLRVAVRTGDVVARMGGDEFCVLCEHVSDDAEAREVAQRLLDAVSIPLHLDGRAVQISTSIGIAHDSSGDEMIGSLIRDADVALYGAKHNGRGRAELFRASLDHGTDSVGTRLTTDETPTRHQPRA